MKGHLCHLTKLLSRGFLLCLSLLFCFLSFTLSFGSSPVSAVELTADVWRVSFASDPQFRVKIDGTWYSYTNVPFQVGTNAHVQEIQIKGNSDSGTANGWKWKAQDYFSIDISFYSSASNCDQSFPGSFMWRSNATEVMQSHLVGSYNNADVCFTQWNIITSTWSDGSGILDLLPEHMTSTRANTSILVSNVSQWRHQPPSSGGSFDDSGMISAINNQTAQQRQDAQKQLEEMRKQTEAINDTKDFITNPDTPDSSDIATPDSLPSVGLLPPGPLDSILLLPLNIMNSILSSLGGSCRPVTAPLPFVGKSIEFPCFGDTIYKGDFAPLVNIVGGVGSAFILYGYFKHLYKKVDRAVSLETSDEDEWGVL